jgi:hypothetical protein
MSSVSDQESVKVVPHGSPPPERQPRRSSQLDTPADIFDHVMKVSINKAEEALELIRASFAMFDIVEHGHKYHGIAKELEKYLEHVESVKETKSVRSS